MKLVSWLVFLTFVGLSAFANYQHGQDRLAGFLLAIVPVGFAVVVFIVEALHAAGRATGWLYLGAGLVGGGAGVASYLGLFGMARDHGVQLVPALLLPLAFDGVVAVASMGIRGFAGALAPEHTPERAPLPVICSAPLPLPVLRSGLAPEHAPLHAEVGAPLRSILPEYAPAPLPAPEHAPLPAPALAPEHAPALLPAPPQVRTLRSKVAPPEWRAALLHDRYDTLPTQAVIRSELGWGAGVTSAAVKTLRELQSV